LLGDDEELGCSIFFDMRSLFESSCLRAGDPTNVNAQRGTDFTFSILSSSPTAKSPCDVVYRAHKCILAARSPYFYSLFSSEQVNTNNTLPHMCALHYNKLVDNTLPVLQTSHTSVETFLMAQVRPRVLEKTLYHIYTDDILPYDLEEVCIGYSHSLSKGVY